MKSILDALETSIAISLFVAVLFFSMYGIVIFSLNVSKDACLGVDYDAPRRWKPFDCQEYKDGEWQKIWFYGEEK